MFDLDKAIAEWRREIAVAGIKRPQVMDELESHLREDVQQQMRLGLNAQQAFEIARRQIGQVDLLQAEFKKAQSAKEMRPGKLLGIACGAIACFFSLLILQTLITAHEPDLAERMLGLAAFAFIVFSWKYGHRFLPVIRNRHVRTVIGIVCCMAGAVWMAIFINFILPHLFDHPAGLDLPVGRLLDAFLWAMTLIAVLGAIADGLEKAAHRKTATADS